MLPNLSLLSALAALAFPLFASAVVRPCEPAAKPDFSFASALPRNETPAAFPLPVPVLTADFRMVVDLNPRVSVGAGPWGQRNWISFTGGRWAASWGSGVVVEGGQDSQLVIGDLSARLDTSYLLATNDVPPAYIAIRTQGWRTGPREVLERLGNPATADAVAPAEYSFRLYISMETGDGRYNHTNTKMWIASGARLGSKVVYDAYLV